MSFFKSIITKVVLPVLILAFFISCITQAPPIPAQKPPTQRPVTQRPVTQRPPTPPRDRDYYDNLRNNDRDRDSVLSRARDKSKRDRSPTCEGDDDCEDLCSDIYSSRSDKNDCEELSVDQVESLEVVSEAFEDPDIDDLEELDLSDVEVYLNISIEPLHKLIGKYNSRKARHFLTWIAQNSDAAEVLEDEDDDYEVLSRLFDEIVSITDSTSATRIFPALKANVDSGTFMDLAVEAGNEFALEWVYDYIEDQETDCSGSTSDNKIDCLAKWCSLGASMSRRDEYADELLEYDFFQDYLDNVISEKINGVGATGSCVKITSTPATFTSTILVGARVKWNDNDNCDNGERGYIGHVDDLDIWWKGDSDDAGLCPTIIHD